MHARPSPSFHFSHWKRKNLIPTQNNLTLSEDKEKGALKDGILYAFFPIYFHTCPCFWFLTNGWIKEKVEFHIYAFIISSFSPPFILFWVFMRRNMKRDYNAVFVRSLQPVSGNSGNSGVWSSPQVGEATDLDPLPIFTRFLPSSFWHHEITIVRNREN